MHMKFNYPNKVRNDFLHDVVKPMIKRRIDLGMTQEDLNASLGVADRLVSKWECGVRTPTSFHLYCWADALKGKIAFQAIDNTSLSNLERIIIHPSNDNHFEENYNRMRA